MRKALIKVAAAALMMGALAAAGPAQTAHAGQISHDTVVDTQTPTPTVQLLDCEGTTGGMGCGPGWIWRDGWRGFACYPC